MTDQKPQIGMKVRFRNPAKMLCTESTCNRGYLACLIQNWGNRVFTIQDMREPYTGAWLVRLEFDGKPLTAEWNKDKGKKPHWFKLVGGEIHWERYLEPA